MNELLFMSRTTGNVFCESSTNTYARIGFMRDGEFVERDGIGATFSPQFVRDGIETGFLVPMVRLIGGNLMAEAEYAEIEIHCLENPD